MDTIINAYVIVFSGGWVTVWIGITIAMVIAIFISASRYIL